MSDMGEPGRADATATVIERNPNGIVVRIRGDRLDETNVAAVRAQVAAVGAESPQTPVGLDMSNIAFMPSLSLGALIQLSQVFKSRGQRLILGGLQPPVRQILAITRLDRLFEIQDDLSSLSK